jgi:hypothetical protein
MKKRTFPQNVDFPRVKNLIDLADILPLVAELFANMAEEDFSAMAETFDIDMTVFMSANDFTDWLQSRAVSVVDEARAKESAGER